MLGPILDLLFPNANEGALILQISSLQIIFTILEQTVNGALQGLGKIYIPAIALTVGVVVKTILNLVLVPISTIGAIGAAIATAACHAIAFIIGYCVLRKNMKIDLTFSKFIIKPVFASLIMAICSYAAYLLFNSLHPGRIATIIGIITAIIIYILAVIALKVFTKEEILMIPYGGKIYKILEKLGIYKNAEMQ